MEVRGTHYFSTHGCKRALSGLAGPALELEALTDWALSAAAAARALLEKKLVAMESREKRTGITYYGGIEVTLEP